MARARQAKNPDTTKTTKVKKRRKVVRTCLPLPPRDTTLDTIKDALQGTRFAASVGQLVEILESKERATSPDIYGASASTLVERFVARDAAFDYGLDKTGDMVAAWKVGLELCKRRTQERASDGQAMFYVSDYPGEDIARVFADVCFYRYAYEDLSSASASTDVTTATEDAETVKLIVETKILGVGLGQLIDIVELLRLFAMF